MATSGHVLVDVAAGDLVEVSSDEERLTGRLIEYTGEFFVGRSGRSLRFYRDNDFEFRIIEKAPRVQSTDPAAVDQPTVHRIGAWLRSQGRHGMAEAIENRFGQSVTR